MLSGLCFAFVFSSKKDKTDKVSIKSISGHHKTMQERSMEQESEEQRKKKKKKQNHKRRRILKKVLLMGRGSKQRIKKNCLKNSASKEMNSKKSS